MKNAHLTNTDRFGIAAGTLIFLLMLPVTIFVSAIPAMAISNIFTNKVVALTLNLGVIGIGAFITLVVSMIGGLALCYGAAWLGKKIHLQNPLSHNAERPIEASRRVNRGALVGLGLGGLAFILKGATPIGSVTERVEHLFPGQLVLSLGNIFTFDVSHTYAVATGFLSVGFLFVIAGIALGSLVSAVLETVMARQSR